MTMTYLRTCATDGCTAPPSGKSKYCAGCKPAARAAWKAMIEGKAAERIERDARYAEIHAQAWAAGVAAGEALTPEPMVVAQHANVLDDASPIVEAWVVPDGPCGYAQVHFRPANHPYVNWLKRSGVGIRSSYHGGADLWIHAYNQSMERKYAHARAYADVVKAAGIDRLFVMANSRMD